MTFPSFMNTANMRGCLFSTNDHRSDLTGCWHLLLDWRRNYARVPITRPSEGTFVAGRRRGGVPANCCPVATQRRRRATRGAADVRTGPGLQRCRRETPKGHLEESRIFGCVRNIGFSLGKLVERLVLDDVCSATIQSAGILEKNPPQLAKPPLAALGGSMGRNDRMRRCTCRIRGAFRDAV
jgi:hypothetical protein